MRRHVRRDVFDAHIIDIFVVVIIKISLTGKVGRAFVFVRSTRLPQRQHPSATGKAALVRIGNGRWCR
jgi:hypothetical protein